MGRKKKQELLPPDPEMTIISTVRFEMVISAEKIAKLICGHFGIPKDAVFQEMRPDVDYNGDLNSNQLTFTFEKMNIMKEARPFGIRAMSEEEIKGIEED